jgi:hypothetical protein
MVTSRLEQVQKILSVFVPQQFQVRRPASSPIRAMH